jgi:hypothetical protein
LPWKSITSNPIRVRFFGADAEMLAPDHVAHLIEQFGFVLHGSSA